VTFYDAHVVIMTMYESYSDYRAGSGSGNSGRDEFVPDPVVLKKLRLLIETDDQQTSAPLKKLKICGRDLSELPLEVFAMVELEVGAEK